MVLEAQRWRGSHKNKKNMKQKVISRVSRPGQDLNDLFREFIAEGDYKIIHVIDQQDSTDCSMFRAVVEPIRKQEVIVFDMKELKDPLFPIEVYLKGFIGKGYHIDAFSVVPLESGFRVFAVIG